MRRGWWLGMTGQEVEMCRLVKPCKAEMLRLELASKQLAGGMIEVRRGRGRTLHVAESGDQLGVRLRVRNRGTPGAVGRSCALSSYH